MTPLPETHDPGPISVIRAIVTQAFVDYFILYRMGAIKEMQNTGYFKARMGRNDGEGSLIYQYMTPSHVPELLDFIENHMHRLIGVLGHRITPLALRERILHLERSGEWQDHFGRGVKYNPLTRQGPEPMSPMQKGDAPKDAPLDLLPE